MTGIPLDTAARRFGGRSAGLWGRRRRQAADARRLEARLAAALAAHPLLASLGLTTRARLPLGWRVRPLVELRGEVPSAAAYREVLKILCDHAWRARPDVGVIDRIVLAPPRRP
jgi:hypothetical protein